jgi:hypothetical protein
MGRSIGAVVIGVIAGLVAVVVGDAIAVAIHPLPPGVDRNDREALKAIAASLPTRAFIAVFLGWVAAAFVGPLAGAKVAAQRQMMHAMIVGGMLLAATVGNLASIPHPSWMWVGALVVFPLGAFLAGRLVQPSESFTRA